MGGRQGGRRRGRESSASIAMWTNLGEGKRDRDAKWVGEMGGRDGGRGRGRETRASIAMCTNLGEGKRDRDAKWVRGREGGGGGSRGPPPRCGRTWERGRGIGTRNG